MKDPSVRDSSQKDVTDSSRVQLLGKTKCSGGNEGPFIWRVIPYWYMLHIRDKENLKTICWGEIGNESSNG